MKRSEKTTYLLMVFVSEASAQYFYVPVYFGRVYSDAELIFLLFAVALRALLAPFMAHALNDFVRLNIVVVLLFRSPFNLALYLRVPLELGLMIVLGVLYGLASSLLLFLNAVYFSYSEPTFSSKYRSTNYFIFSKFLSYTMGNIISAIILFNLDLPDLFLFASLVWLSLCPLVLTLKIEKGEVREAGLK